MKIPLRAGEDYTLFLSDSLSKITYWAVICKVLARISARQTNKKKSICTTVQGHQQGTYVNPERHSDMPVQETNLLFKANRLQLLPHLVHWKSKAGFYPYAKLRLTAYALPTAIGCLSELLDSILLQEIIGVFWSAYS